MGLLDGKTVLVSGVFNESSIAFANAAMAQRQGATAILTGFGRRRRMTETIARRLPEAAPVVEFDATVQDDVAALAGRLAPHADRIDGVVHCISASLPTVVGRTLDASVTWRVYGWAGVAKAAYESVNQYLAMHLAPRGIRCNLVSSGPVDSFTMKAIEGIDTINGMWEARSPLAWDRTDSTPVAKTLVALLSDWLPATTGEVIHADGGFHSVAY